MQIIKVDELVIISWNDNTCQFIHKKCHQQSYHDEVIYNVIVSIIFDVVK